MERGKLCYVKTACGDVFEGETILVAAGHSSRALLYTVGVDIPMNKALLECIVTEAEPPMFEQMLCAAMADFYGHQTPHGSFVFGGHKRAVLRHPCHGEKQPVTGHFRSDSSPRDFGVLSAVKAHQAGAHVGRYDG